MPFLKGLGLRERVLSLLGASDLYRQLHEAKSSAENLTAKLNQLEVSAVELKAQLALATQLEAALADAQAQYALAAARLVHFDGLKGADRLIELDFAIKPRVRHGWGQASSPLLVPIIGQHEAQYVDTMRSFKPYIAAARAIEPHPINEDAPHWINDWLPAFDAFSIYSYLAKRNPGTYLEIGSGTSTKFARQAIKDFKLRTKIVSIDPYPRSGINKICDDIIRKKLEDADLSMFGNLSNDDVLFFDGSHRSFQNSDVTVFFTEILPKIPKSVLIGVHDIFLPDDYPPEWLERFYSEQYLLACWLLAGQAIRIELPIWYCSNADAIRSHLDDLWKAPNLEGANIHGGIFWFTHDR
jgi:hypothetical protein